MGLGLAVVFVDARQIKREANRKFVRLLSISVRATVIARVGSIPLASKRRRCFLRMSSARNNKDLHLALAGHSQYQERLSNVPVKCL